MVNEQFSKTEIKEPLDKIAQHLEEEARMVLPGIQALFGFQLIAVFNQKFNDIPKSDQYSHLAALLCTTLAIILVLTPAAFHRQAEPTKISERFCKLGSKLLSLSMIPLMLGICLDLFVVTNVILENALASLTVAGIVLAALAYSWFIFPQMNKSRTKSL